MPQSPETSSILSLPFIQPAQSQKHVTHNEAIQTLDILVQLTVVAVDANAPPADPEVGDVFALGAAPTSEWAGQAGMLAACQPEGWIFVAPMHGWRAYDKTGGKMYVHDGTHWVAQDPILQNLPGVGVNASSDVANRLAVRSPATLFTHDGSDHQVKINKAGVDNTASLLFQSNWTGLAEMGLTGNNNFTIKVGADFADALIAGEHGNFIKSGKSLGVAVDVPTDLWSYSVAPQSVLFMNHGYFGHNGGFEQGLWWNGYRNIAGGWSSMGLNDWAAGAGIALGNSGIRFMWQATPTGSAPSELYRMESTGMRPIQDNARQLGTASARWAQVFSGAAAINTSDGRLKKAVTNDAATTAAEKRAARRIRKAIRKYRMTEAMDAKGSAARLHFGVYAQDVEEILRDEGLEPFAYAFLCRDECVEEIWEKDATGEQIARTHKTGDVIYGIRYEELAMFLFLHS